MQKKFDLFCKRYQTTSTHHFPCKIIPEKEIVIMNFLFLYFNRVKRCTLILKNSFKKCIHLLLLTEHSPMFIEWCGSFFVTITFLYCETNYYVWTVWKFKICRVILIFMTLTFLIERRELIITFRSLKNVARFVSNWSLIS